MGTCSGLSFPILGVRFRATGGSGALGTWLRSGWDFPHHDVPARPFTIRLRTGDGPGPAPPPDAIRHTASAVNGPSVVWRARGETWWTGDRRHGVRLRVRPGGASIRAWPAGPASVAIYMALCEAVRAAGLIPLHAAVATRDGITTAFLGPSGTGKSTTLLQAVQAGWTPVAEDFSWIDPADGSLYGWDRGLRVRPDALERFAPELLERGDLERDAQGKVVLSHDPFARDGDRADDHALGPPRLRLDRVVLLERDPSAGDVPTAWSPLPARDAVRALWEGTGVPLRAAARERTAAWVARAARDVEARRLTLGSTPLAPLLSPAPARTFNGP